jgi:CHAT domain-containing protein
VQAPRSFLGFAPVFGGEKPADEMLASRYLAQRGDSTVLRSATVRGKYFEELPNSEKEVSDIYRCFSEKGLFSQEFLRQDATEEAFKANAGRYSVVHIATHGLVDEADPRMSALVFTPNDTTLSQEDGILYADEVQDLKLNADLVVLSSCESGVGKMVRGEGLMALTRGFFYAGARNVVFSLWRVIDRQTSDLMSLFYKEVLAGRSYSYALRAAKLKMIATPGSAYPLNWAGFVLVGR